MHKHGVFILALYQLWSWLNAGKMHQKTAKKYYWHNTELKLMLKNFCTQNWLLCIMLVPPPHLPHKVNLFPMTWHFKHQYLFNRIFKYCIPGYGNLDWIFKHRILGDRTLPWIFKWGVFGGRALHGAGCGIALHGKMGDWLISNHRRTFVIKLTTRSFQ